MFLALDIGGTKVSVALASEAGGRLALGPVQGYATASSPSLEALLDQHFRGKVPPLKGAGVAVAGPVIGRRSQLTNVPWQIDADQIGALLETHVTLLNDLEAHAHAVAQAAGDELVTLQAGTLRTGNRCVIAAGTGLGEALLFPVGDRWRAAATEGGHASFAPTTDLDTELLGFLRRRYEHVSWERVVSGLDGFRNLYDFLAESKRITPSPSLQAAAAATHDLGGPIIVAATSGDPAARTILEWFVRLYGAEAGNLALKSLAVGGVYIAGGIAPRILSWMKGGAFLQGFTDKGRFGRLLSEVPVHIMVNPYAPLIGAAYAAAAAAGAAATA